MTARTEHGMNIRAALPAETALVAGVLQAAAAGQRERGQAQWAPHDVDEATVGPHVRAGLYHLALDGPAAVGVFRLELEDPDFWPDMPEGSAAYVHKMAVVPARQRQGIAPALLGHACALARLQGRRFLRLDCMSGWPGLRRVYEGFGFRFHSHWRMGGSLFDRFEYPLRED